MNRIKKIESFVLVALVLLLPTQAGLHFWPQWAYIGGVRVDYFAPTLFVTDALILCLVTAEIIRSKGYFPRYLGKARVVTPLLIVGGFIAINILTSLSPMVSLYKWIKAGELMWFGYFVAKRLPDFFTLSKLTFLLAIPIMVLSTLTMLQFFRQASVGGLWYFLGERTFSAATLGIANTTLSSGALILRPYGLFPHPNVLGGFIACLLPFFLYEFLHNSRNIAARGKIITLALVCAFGTLCMSFSRTAILVGTVGLLLTIVALKQKKRHLVWLVPGFFLTVGAFSLLSISPLQDSEAWTIRASLLATSSQAIVAAPVWGHGLGTAPLITAQSSAKIANLALFYQPVHNIYFLLVSEIGLVGLAAFLIVVHWGVKTVLVSPTRVPILCSLGVILVLGLNDHYFLTIQQAQLLLALVLGLAYRQSKKIQYGHG